MGQPLNNRLGTWGWLPGVVLAFGVAACTTRAPRLVVVGDLALARGLAEQGGGLWEDWRYQPEDVWIANFEGAVAGASGCPGTAGIDLCVREAEFAQFDFGPIDVLAQANNHAGDAGAADQSVANIVRAGMRWVGPHDPLYVTVGRREWAVIALDLSSPGAQFRLEAAEPAVARARLEADRVLVLVHTGSELDPRPGAGESEAMDRLRVWGADLVVGSGAHIIQEANCAGESARFSGLGNFLFDMVAPETRRGLVLTCEEVDEEILCSTQVVLSERGDPRPRLVGERGPECRFRPTPPVEDDWRAFASAAHFDFVQPFPEAGEGNWFGTWTRPEEFDSLIVPRPRVFSVRDELPGQVGRDVWRGSSLARPLVSARVLRHGGEARLCALERGDTVFAPDPTTRQRIWRVWAWTGFGFRVDPGFGCEGWSLRPVANSRPAGSLGGSVEDR